jgi:enoyl-CoA hydratase
MTNTCEIVINQKVAMITINRPPMNTLSRDTLLEIDSFLSYIENNESVRAIVITGSGEKIFSAGADVTEFSDFTQPEKARETIRVMHNVFRKIECYSKPIIACINGKALGGGNELQMACHLVISSENAEFALPEVRLGIMPGYGGTQRLPLLIGRRRAIELIMSGEKISAQKAYEYGLVNKVVPQNILLDEALKWAQEIAAGPPIAIKGILDSVIRGTERSLNEGINIEIENMLNVARTEDAIEGISAFFTKRKAEYKGK